LEYLGFAALAGSFIWLFVKRKTRQELPL